jgi:hypothetical protein
VVAAIVILAFALPIVLQSAVTWAGTAVTVSEAGLLAGVATAARAQALARAFVAIGSQQTLLWRTGIQTLRQAALEGQGIRVAGAGVKVGLRQATRLVSQYGGTTNDWVKMTTKDWIMPGGIRTQVHYYLNEATKQIVEMKVKIVN